MMASTYGLSKGYSSTRQSVYWVNDEWTDLGVLMQQYPVPDPITDIFPEQSWTSDKFKVWFQFCYDATTYMY